MGQLFNIIAAHGNRIRITLKQAGNIGDSAMA
jgi:hypothetical protein